MKPNFAFRLYNLTTVCRGNAPTYTEALRSVATLHRCDVAQTLSVFDAGAKVFFVWILSDLFESDSAEPAAEICINQIPASASN